MKLRCYDDEEFIGFIDAEDNILFTHMTRIRKRHWTDFYLSLNKKAFRGQEDDAHIVSLVNHMHSEKSKRRDLIDKFKELADNKENMGKGRK